MSASEFDLIKRYFQHSHTDPSISCGIGDDAAILHIPAAMELAVATDTLLQDTHFPAGTSPSDIAYKALAVNISDMLAMGATPKWVLLSLSLPNNDPDWLKQFSAAFLAQAKHWQISLIGGDLSQGPLSLTVHIQGLLPRGTALKRSGAKANDAIYITGTLGNAGLGLDIIQQKRTIPESHRAYFLESLNRPPINIALGPRLRPLANSAIDISDGLFADLGHLLEASQLGAEIEIEKLPLSVPMRAVVAETTAWNYALTAGDDYQLCFTASPANHSQIIATCAELAIAVCQIGKTTVSGGLRCQTVAGTEWKTEWRGYQHFSSHAFDHQLDDQPDHQ